MKSSSNWCYHPADQYATHIIGSLPSYYQCHLSTVDAAARASGLAQAAAQTAALATAQATAAASTSTAPQLLHNLPLHILQVVS